MIKFLDNKYMLQDTVTKSVKGDTDVQIDRKSV